MPDVVFELAFVEDEIRTAFVDGIVREMDSHVLLIRRAGFLVIASG